MTSEIQERKIYYIDIGSLPITEAYRILNLVRDQLYLPRLKYTFTTKLLIFFGIWELLI